MQLKSKRQVWVIGLFEVAVILLIAAAFASAIGGQAASTVFDAVRSAAK